MGVDRIKLERPADEPHITLIPDVLFDHVELRRVGVLASTIRFTIRPLL